MKKLFTFIAVICLALNASAQYQVANSDFEKWTASSGEPDHWHGFKSASGGLAGSAMGTLGYSEDRHSGQYSALITAGSVFGIVNNGTFTTGQLNASSMSASNTKNHAHMDVESDETDNNGDKFYMPFTGHPDAMVFWYKFTQGTAQSTYKYASANAVIFDGSYYQDPEDKTYTNVVAKAGNKTITTTTSWTELIVPFEYTSNNVTPQAILVTFGTNATPGKGSDGDKVWIDDVKFIYYSQLKSLTINGVSVPGFDKDVYNYTVDSYYIEGTTSVDAVDNTKAGVATIAKNYDATTGKYTIVVTNQEGSESHTYTIQFKQYGYDLLSLAYNGVPITGYEQDGDALDVVLDEEFDINKLSYTLSEYAESTFDYDEETGFLAITVTSKNGNSAEYDFNIYRRGDINNDSQVSIADVTSLVNIILGKQPDYKVLVADVNGDKGVSIADVTALVNIILGKAN